AAPVLRGSAGGRSRRPEAACDSSSCSQERPSPTASPPSPSRTPDKTRREPRAPRSPRGPARPSSAALLLRTSWLHLRKHHSQRLVPATSSRLHRLHAFAEGLRYLPERELRPPVQLDDLPLCIPHCADLRPHPAPSL